MAGEGKKANTETQRRQIIAELFPDGVPTLWCPVVTHYRTDGSIDVERVSAHLHFLAPHIGGILLPGSTGDGWQQTADEKRALVASVVPDATRHGLAVLVGVLEAALDEMLASLTELAGSKVFGDVSGVVVCAPRGASVSQSEIARALARILDRNLPTVLYQLPQITKNEISPLTIEELASRYPNFLMLKDSGGADTIARSGRSFGGVFLVRGAELGYTEWLKPRGPYDGFLLSTANWLAPSLRALTEAGTGDEKKQLAARVDRVVAGAFALVEDFTHGNAFANSAKLMDHVMAHGPQAPRVAGPRYRNGATAPADRVEAAVRLLRENDLMPDHGYLAG